jgi:hypothetical protein
MPTIKNMSYGALSITLASGETVTLGPHETAEVTQRDITSEAVQKQIRQEAITVVKERPDLSVPEEK